jgi:L-fucose isomerase-like protein
MMLEYLARRPTFMGNLGYFNRDEGWVAIAHCAATTRMDGYDAEPAPLHLEDYHGRGTGVATYSPMREGQVVTLARLDRDQRHLSLAAGPVVDATRGKGCINQLRVAIGDVQDFAERCVAGDHYAVVYGDVAPQARQLCRELDIGVWEPGEP